MAEWTPLIDVIRDVLNEEKIAAAVVKAGWRQAQEKAVLLQ
jgi:hypothetical protein